MSAASILRERGRLADPFLDPPPPGAWWMMAPWVARSRQRRRLAHLEDHPLDDIGRSRDEARSEARKPFWTA